MSLTLLAVTKLCATGDQIGVEMEEAFFAEAEKSGLTDEEARSAFNSNMMATGLLSEAPAEFAREHGRRWLVSAYEAGDVVLHKPHMVCTLAQGWGFVGSRLTGIRSRFTLPPSIMILTM